MATKDLQVDARSLREPLHLERPPEKTHPHSRQRHGAWERYASPRGRVEPLSGREFWQAQEVGATTSHRVTIRYVSGLSSEDRVVFRGRHLHITSIVNVEERDRFYILLCTEKSS